MRKTLKKTRRGWVITSLAAIGAVATLATSGAGNAQTTSGPVTGETKVETALAAPIHEKAQLTSVPQTSGTSIGNVEPLIEKAKEVVTEIVEAILPDPIQEALAEERESRTPVFVQMSEEEARLAQEQISEANTEIEAEEPVQEVPVVEEPHTEPEPHDIPEEVVPESLPEEVAAEAVPEEVATELVTEEVVPEPELIPEEEVVTTPEDVVEQPAVEEVIPEAHLPDVTETREVVVRPYHTAQIPNDELYEGETRVVVNGQNTEIEVVTTVTTLDGVEIDRTTSEVVLTPGLAEVVEYGTKPREVPGYTLPLRLNPGEALYMTSPFGEERNLTLLDGRQLKDVHRGVDWATSSGQTMVTAAASGVVVFAGELDGNAVVIQHPDGLYTTYWHMADIRVVPGQEVAQGDDIGMIGATGQATGVHLHFAISTSMWSGHVDPLAYIN